MKMNIQCVCPFGNDPLLQRTLFALLPLTRCLCVLNKQAHKNGEQARIEKVWKICRIFDIV